MSAANARSDGARGYTFRCNDLVRHVPSGRRWVLACDESDGYVYPMGWPEIRVDASDCVLLEPSTDFYRLANLRIVAELYASRVRGDSRARLAADQLALEEK